jgi:hypothetical protein
MDKMEFLDKAPACYALGIVTGITNLNGPVLIGNISYGVRGDDYNLFKRIPLLHAALDILVSENVIDIITDDFGPPMYKKTNKFSNWLTFDAVQKFSRARYK